MLKVARPSKVLIYQSIGFLAIIGVCLLDELVGISALLFSNQTYISNFRQSILKVLLIFGVWLLVAGSTRRVLQHMRYLEAFMKVCAWCRRLEHKGHWMPIEEFFERGFDTPTSHGICQECLAKAKASIEQAKQIKKQAEEAAAQTSPAPQNLSCDHVRAETTSANSTATAAQPATLCRH
jgi:hypothetical protein